MARRAPLKAAGWGEAAVRVHHPAFDCLPADRLDRLSLDQLFREILNLITPIGGEAPFTTRTSNATNETGPRRRIRS
jgi:hypothetical protein